MCAAQNFLHLHSLSHGAAVCSPVQQWLRGLPLCDGPAVVVRLCVAAADVDAGLAALLRFATSAGGVRDADAVRRSLAALCDAAGKRLRTPGSLLQLLASARRRHALFHREQDDCAALLALRDADPLRLCGMLSALQQQLCRSCDVTLRIAGDVLRVAAPSSLCATQLATSALRPQERAVTPVVHDGRGARDRARHCLVAAAPLLVASDDAWFLQVRACACVRGVPVAVPTSCPTLWRRVWRERCRRRPWSEQTPSRLRLLLSRLVS